VDNTAQNVRDRADQTLTPGDQGGTPADRETTRKIRRAITSNDQLSTTAKNIKIMTVDGKVTLRGPVKTEEEKKQITDLAASVVQPDKLDNQLEVKAATSPTSTDNK
jgi:hyperosmotically inducible protein